MSSTTEALGAGTTTVAEMVQVLVAVKVVEPRHDDGEVGLAHALRFLEGSS
jgi:hypothetical protein